MERFNETYVAAWVCRCGHSNETRYDPGSPAEDYVCVNCGEVVHRITPDDETP